MGTKLPIIPSSTKERNGQCLDERGFNNALSQTIHYLITDP